jgi:hypothetical protein
VIEWDRLFLENLEVANLAKVFYALIKFEYSLPYSQEPETGPYPEPEDSSPHAYLIFLILSYHVDLGP